MTIGQIFCAVGNPSWLETGTTTEKGSKMFRQAKTWFLCYLMMSSLAFSMAEEQYITPEEVEELTRNTLKEYEEEVGELVKIAPEDPNNDIDDPEKPRLFGFLLALLPKLVMMVVHVAVKAAPLIIKAVAVVKAKAIACAAAAAAAAKAKAVALAAAAAAKVASPAAIKATIVTGVTKLAKFAAEELIVEGITAGIEYAVDAASPASEDEEKPVVEEEEPETVSSNIFDYYDNDELCECSSKTHCSCCVDPKKGKGKACLEIELSSNLWNNACVLKIGAFYGGKNIATRRLPVNQPRQRCFNLPQPFQTTKMCVSVHGRTAVGNRMIQCLSLHFDRRGLTKCLVQNRRNKIWFKTDV